MNYLRTIKNLLKSLEISYSAEFSCSVDWKGMVPLKEKQKEGEHWWKGRIFLKYLRAYHISHNLLNQTWYTSVQQMDYGTGVRSWLPHILREVRHCPGWSLDFYRLHSSRGAHGAYQGSLSSRCSRIKPTIWRHVGGRGGEGRRRPARTLPQRKLTNP